MNRLDVWHHPGPVLVSVLLASLALLGCTGCGSERSPSGATENGIEVVVSKEQLGEGRPRALYVDDTHIYWSQAVHGIRRIPKEGGEVETLGSFSSISRTPILTDATHVYWMDSDRIDKKSRFGGPASHLDLGESFVHGPIAQDERHIYFAQISCFKVGRITKDGDKRLVWAVNDIDRGGSTRLAVDDDFVYCANRNTIWRMTKTGEELAVVYGGPLSNNIAGLITVENELYWINNGTSPSIPKEIVRMPKTSGTPKVVVRGERGAAPVLHYDVARTTLYWVTGISSISAVKAFDIDDGDLVELATSRPIQGGPAGDATHLYWPEQDQIVRIRKEDP